MPAQRQARIEQGEDVIVGVNKYQVEGETEELDVLSVDNTKVRDAQVRRLAEVRAARNDAAAETALANLTNAAQENTGNLLELAIEAGANLVRVGTDIFGPRV